MASTGRPRRVLIIVENLPVPFDRRVWSEATTLRDAGYEVEIICPTGKGAEARFEELEGIRIHRHPLPAEGRGAGGYLAEYGAALFHEFRLAFRIHRQRGFDVIHACNPPDLIFLVGAVFKYLFGRKFLFDHHDLCPELYIAKFGHKGAFYRLLRGFERLTFAVADVSIATNESYRAIAIDRGGMRPERTFVVRSGPNLARVRRMEPDPAWRRGRRHLVGYVGVIGAQEGLDLLVEAVRHIVETRHRHDIQFVVCGSGPELATIRRLIERLRLDDFITLTGRVDDDTLWSALSTADVCVNPDRVNEMNDKSTMNKIMEYMALGKPIVQFDVTEGRFSAQSASLYAAPNDAADFGDKIIELIDDPERRARMGAFGRQRVVDTLSWSHQVPELLAAYDALFAAEEELRARQA